VIEHNGKFFAQTNAILRFLGTKHGYYPVDPIEAWKADSIIDSLGDISSSFIKAKYCDDPEKQKELFHTLLSETIPNWLNVLEKRLLANSSKEHLVGDGWTIADFALAAFFNSFFFNEANEAYTQLHEILKKNEHLHQYGQHLNKDLHDYLSKRPSPRSF